MRVETVRKTVKGKVYTSVLLRRSFRKDGKVQHETLGNLTRLPPDVIEFIKRRLSGELDADAPHASFEIVRSLPHGHVAAVLQTAKQLGLESLLASRSCRERELVMALIVARVLSPRSKLSTMSALKSETAKHALAEELELGDVEVHQLYAAMDWLAVRQTRIENKLAKKHLQDGHLVLFDVSSSYYTGRKSPLIKYGYSRDHRSDRPQIVYGLLCDSEGRPIAIEVIPGNTADPPTFTQIVGRARKRFGINRIVFVGDRGMITTARINEDLRGVEGLDWISALRSEGIRKLLEAGTIQMSLFDQQDLAEVTSEHFPGERLVVCRNPALAEQRARKRKELLEATEAQLEPIRLATLRTRNPLRGEQEIGLRVGQVIGKHKMAKHFDVTITKNSFTYARHEQRIRDEAALDGLYVVRSSVAKKHMDSDRVVEHYKSLAKVERAFRCMKTVDLSLRPIYHRNDDRIRSHVFICMLAYYVEWHMRESLRPVLFADEDRESAATARESIVAPAQRSESAKRKDATRRNSDGFPVQNFHDILQDLGTLCRNRVRIPEFDSEFDRLTLATPYQQHVFDLLGITMN
ncbi:MAG: IS1634 family transposase [Planctomycetia bacterium]|nr:IS1634 family transposase [Planctomycetia bacterium]